MIRNQMGMAWALFLAFGVVYPYSEATPEEAEKPKSTG